MGVSRHKIFPTNRETTAKSPLRHSLLFSKKYGTCLHNRYKRVQFRAQKSVCFEGTVEHNTPIRKGTRAKLPVKFRTALDPCHQQRSCTRLQLGLQTIKYCKENTSDSQNMTKSLISLTP